MSPLALLSYPHYYALLCSFWIDGQLSDSIWYRDPILNKLVVFTDKRNALKEANDLSTNSTLVVVHEYWPDETDNYLIVDEYR